MLGKLDQDVAAPVEGKHVAILERRQELAREVVLGAEVEAHLAEKLRLLGAGFFGDGGLQPIERATQLGCVGVRPGRKESMGRCDDAAHPGLPGRGEEGDGGVEVARAVVDPGQDVIVDVHEIHGAGERS